MRADKKQNTELRVLFAPGRLPELWKRQVLFVANLMGLFFGNEEETGELRDQVGPLETYGGRLIPILDLLFHGPGSNMVVLEQSPDSRLLGYFQESLGLRLPDIEVLPHELYRQLASPRASFPPGLESFLERVQAHSSEWLDGFVTDASLENLAALLERKTICTRQASRHGNNKFLLHEHLVSAGLPVFDTEIAGEQSEVASCLNALRQQGYDQAALKAQIGASGIGLIRLPTRGDTSIPEYLFHEGPCLVQGWLDHSVDQVSDIKSPSTQLFLEDSGFTLFDITDQILSADSIHEGNIAPPPWLAEDPASLEELLRQSEACARWLHAQGYRGTASVDFHVAERAGRREIRVCEINARVTGATYPSILARHFTPQGVWLMRNLKFSSAVESSIILQAMKKRDLLFLPGRREGILPINLNLNEEGQAIKGQFLCLGESFDDTMKLLDHVRDVLPVKGEYDRD
jgi:hypothetical protein